MPSYESPSNSESNGIYNININSIKKFISQTFPKIVCYHIFSQKTEKNNMKALQILSPTVYITYILVL